jgi:hypothetical protein
MRTRTSSPRSCPLRSCPVRSWTPAERLAHFTRRDPLSGCWIWQGKPDREGYCRLSARPGGKQLAHRFAWSVRHGPIPAGAIVCHRCDERRCVNPEHLFVGTRQANMDDLKAKRLRRASAADTGRMHIFIRGRELVGDVAWKQVNGETDDEP